MAESQYIPRLRTQYDSVIRKALTEQFKYTNPMQVPQLDKVVHFEPNRLAGRVRPVSNTLDADQTAFSHRVIGLIEVVFQRVRTCLVGAIEGQIATDQVVTVLQKRAARNSRDPARRSLDQSTT